MKCLKFGVFVAALLFSSSPTLANPPPDLVRAALACAMALADHSVKQQVLTKDGWRVETANMTAKDYAAGLGLTAYGRGASTANVLAGTYDGVPACLAIGPIPNSANKEEYAAKVLDILKPEKTVRDGADYVMKKLGRIFVLNMPDNGSERIAAIRVMKRN
ncbi:MAG: hypothetical protein LH610_04535 [Sphingomonas bacterium]|nr:hypothetical protein [Sphingomonas bacterium]